MKKFLALFLVMISVFSLCACGSKNTESEPEESETEEVVSEETEGSKTDNSEVSSEPKVEKQQLSGLIFCDATIESLSQTYSIYSIDPNTKQRTDINSFRISGDYYIVQGNGTRQMFSEDFTKIAITRSFYKGTSLTQHAGWMTSDGVFHDMVEDLNLDPGGDFDKPKHYLAAGFSDDGYFVFRPEKGNNSYGYQSIPMNNFTASAIEDRNALMKSVEPEKDYNNAWYQNTEVVTAWIDETHAIVNHCMVTDTVRDSRIANFQTKTLEPYIYGDDMSNYSSGRRMCYDAVMNPKNNNEVIFMSCQVPLYEQSDLYLVHLNNKNEQPQKVDLGRKFTLFSPHSPKSYTRLIAWK